MLKSLFNKVESLNSCKEASAQVFSCEYCEIFKNNFFYKRPTGGCLIITTIKVIAFL